MKKSLLAAALMAALSGGAMAQGYAGFDVGSTRITDLGTKTGFGIYGGYAFSKTVAAELGYRKLGSYPVTLPGFPTVDIDASSVQLSGLFGAELSAGYVAYARLGFNQIKLKGSYQGSSASESDSKFLWGIGLDAKFTDSISGRVEYQKPASDTGTFSVGLKFGF